MNRIVAKFDDLKSRNESAFIPFLCAGDPDIAATEALIEEFDRRGADVIELGFPFSDPVADGAVIQAAYTRALDKGLKVDHVLDMVRRLRSRCDLPIVAMVSYSIVFRRGAARFIEEAAAAGIDGATIPDLLIEEADEVFEAAQAHDFCNVTFATPLTTPERKRLAAERSRGFIYYISVAGITGARDSVAADMAPNVAELKAMTDTPVAVGFGVSTPDQALQVGEVADGVIVGSAIVKQIAACIENGEDPTPRVGAFVADLAAGAKRGVG